MSSIHSSSSLVDLMSNLIVQEQVGNSSIRSVSPRRMDSADTNPEPSSPLAKNTDGTCPRTDAQHDRRAHEDSYNGAVNMGLSSRTHTSTPDRWDSRERSLYNQDEMQKSTDRRFTDEAAEQSGVHFGRRRPADRDTEDSFTNRREAEEDRRPRLADRDMEESWRNSGADEENRRLKLADSKVDDRWRNRRAAEESKWREAEEYRRRQRSRESEEYRGRQRGREAVENTRRSTTFEDDDRGSADRRRDEDRVKISDDRKQKSTECRNQMKYGGFSTTEDFSRSAGRKKISMNERLGAESNINDRLVKERNIYLRSMEEQRNDELILHQQLLKKPDDKSEYRRSQNIAGADDRLRIEPPVMRQRLLENTQTDRTGRHQYYDAEAIIEQHSQSNDRRYFDNEERIEERNEYETQPLTRSKIYRTYEEEEENDLLRLQPKQQKPRGLLDRERSTTEADMKKIMQNLQATTESFERMRMQQLTEKQQLTPEKFDGGGSFAVFMDHFSTCAKYNGWDAAEKAIFLKLALRGSAAVFLTSKLTNGEHSFEEIVKILKTRYGSENQTQLYRAQLRNLKRGKQDGINQFVC